jgi:hypothetical protein
MSKFLYWPCPNCSTPVDFIKQMSYVFQEETEIGNEADFTPEYGLPFHTIECSNCDYCWIITISEMQYMYS